MDLLGGSWVVRSGVISPLISVITIVILLITLLITTHEPPSRVCDVGFGLLGLGRSGRGSYVLVSRARSKSLN